jgi:hypothetical protein
VNISKKKLLRAMKKARTWPFSKSIRDYRFARLLSVKVPSFIQDLSAEMKTHYSAHPRHVIRMRRYNPGE